MSYMPLANSHKTFARAPRASSAQRAFTSAQYSLQHLLQPNKRAAFAALQSASHAVKSSRLAADSSRSQTMADFSLGPSQADADAFMREAQQKPVINDDDETVAPTINPRAPS